MLFRQVFDERLAQYAYLIGCQRTGEALLVDPERDIDVYLDLAASEDLEITAVTETHIHADFLSGAREFAERGVRVYLSGCGGEDWAYAWPGLGAYDVVLVRDGDTFAVGNIGVRVVHTPGHTPEHICFLVTDHGGGADEPMGMVSGDFVFVGDTGRPDLLESAAGVAGAMRVGAESLYESVQTFLELPDYLQVWPGHGAGSACGKALGAVPESTVGYERRFSPAIRAALEGEKPFVDYVLDAQPEPPLYFGRMKRLNRDGVPLLGGLELPPKMAADRVVDAGGVLVDTREDRSAFMRRHAPGSLYAPFDKSFPTVTGSFIDPEEEIYLAVAPDDLEEAVRCLHRIGLDDVRGWVPLAELADHLADAPHASIEEIDMLDVESRLGDHAVALDTRRAAEFAEGHVHGAANVAHTRLLDRLDELDRERTHLVYCRTGARAAVASALLAREGFDVVYVNGLIEDWLSREVGAPS